MGCGSSTDTRLQTVDDSVHVMLAHDKKVQQRKGETPHGYVPRAAHPLLKPKAIQATEQEEGDEDPPKTTTTDTEPESSKSEQ